MRGKYAHTLALLMIIEELVPKKIPDTKKGKNS